VRRLATIVIAVSGCTPGLPDRSSAELVAIEAPYDDGGFGAASDLWDDDPAWWVPSSNGTSIWTRQGQLTDPVPDAVGSGSFRAFADGTALVCGFGGLARWAGGAWTVIPFPDLPNLADATPPYVCSAFAATAVDDAWFVVDSGHLCRYDGGAIPCRDVSTTILSDPTYGPRHADMAITDSLVFITHPTHNLAAAVTDVYAVPRDATPGDVHKVERTGGAASAVHALPGTDQVVIEFDDLEGRSPIVFSTAGRQRVIDIDGELGYVGDGNDPGSYTTVPVADGSIFLVIDRSYVTSHCTGSEDDPVCTPVYHWAEIVVDRDRDGALTEVGHLGVNDAIITGAGVRIDGELRIRTRDGWYRLP